jgi:hypothetical protein
VDETTLSLDPVLRACWMKVGEQTRIPLPANQEKQHCHVFGAYQWAGDQVSWTLAEQRNFHHVSGASSGRGIPDRLHRCGVGSSFLS